MSSTHLRSIRPFSFHDNRIKWAGAVREPRAHATPRIRPLFLGKRVLVRSWQGRKFWPRSSSQSGHRWCQFPISAEAPRTIARVQPEPFCDFFLPFWPSARSPSVVRCPPKPAHSPHARLASGCWPALPGGIRYRRVAMKGFTFEMIPSFSELLGKQPGHPGRLPAPGSHRSGLARRRGTRLVIL